MNAAHFHLLVNEVPILGSAVAAALLAAAALSRKPNGSARAALIALGISSVGVLAAFLSGSPALEVITGLPRTSGRALSQHHVRAVVATALAAAAALAGVVAALIARRRAGGYSRPSLIVVLVATVASTIALSWTGLAGGRINHPELQEPADREGGPARPHQLG
jgi:hypothetical protein